MITTNKVKVETGLTSSGTQHPWSRCWEVGHIYSLRDSAHYDSAADHVMFIYYYIHIIAAWIMFRCNILLLMNEEVSMDDGCTKYITLCIVVVVVVFVCST